MWHKLGFIHCAKYAQWQLTITAFETFNLCGYHCSVKDDKYVLTGIYQVFIHHKRATILSHVFCVVIKQATWTCLMRLKSPWWCVTLGGKLEYYVDN